MPIFMFMILIKILLADGDLIKKCPSHHLAFNFSLFSTPSKQPVKRKIVLLEPFDGNQPTPWMHWSKVSQSFNETCPFIRLWPPLCERFMSEVSQGTRFFIASRLVQMISEMNLYKVRFRFWNFFLQQTNDVLFQHTASSARVETHHWSTPSVN